ncbi:RNA polymerase II degradation factor 1-like isoform X2 [Salarias fasciatus]|uniref:RNA polymerase II degradation factor 1-like isoform X2 n=1 Tax=Salarias fasciatus TaxID=181472 RepID=UPI001176DB8E|nr:RNA polymerase II degradation factor 1-like isoform X2 [Salarias fasciatus]
MKRRRPVTLDTSDEEEEDSNDRRRTLRAQKKVRYSESFVVEEEEEEDNCNHNTQEEMLHVTCGTKEGWLDKKKLERAEACIKCEGKWFTPPQFEVFGRRECSKKWKTSVYHEEKPLQYFFEKGLLTTSGYNKGPRKTTKKKKSSDHESQESSEDSDMESAGDSEEERSSDEDGSEELKQDAEGSEEDKEEPASIEPVGEDGEMDAGNVSSVADDLPDRNVSEELETFPVSKNAVVTLERLPEAELRLQNHLKEPSSSSTVAQPEALQLTSSSQQSVESWCVPLSEVSQSEEERDHNTSAETRDTTSPLTSDPPITEGMLTLQEAAEHTAGSISSTAQSPHSDQETRVDQTCARCAPFSNMAEAAESSDVDTMATDQLKREKLKLQVKVLKLQEMYYSLKISRFLKSESFVEP